MKTPGREEALEIKERDFGDGAQAVLAADGGEQARKEGVVAAARFAGVAGEEALAEVAKGRQNEAAVGGALKIASAGTSMALTGAGCAVLRVPPWALEPRRAREAA